MHSVPMADHSWLRFNLIFITTLGLHLLMISPFADWMDRNLMPYFSEDTIELELVENPPEPLTFQEKETTLEENPVPEREVFEEPPDIDYKFVELPETEKNLSLKAKEDEIVSVIDEVGKKDEDSQKSEEEQKAQEEDELWKTIDQIISKPLNEPPESSPLPDEYIAPEKSETIVSEEFEKDSEVVPQLNDDAENYVETAPEATDENSTEAELIRSPLFVARTSIPEETESIPVHKNTVPEEIRKTFRKNRPEVTNEDNLQFSLNTYQWTYERYMENWAIALQRWWMPPSDYMFGKVPEGGSVWVQVRLGLDGHLLGYKVYESEITSEMELRVIQALIGSMVRPPLPDQFPETELLINWKFIYPPIRSPVKLKKNQ